VVGAFDREAGLLRMRDPRGFSYGDVELWTAASTFDLVDRAGPESGPICSESTDTEQHQPREIRR
jgi:hypothetical protein